MNNSNSHTNEALPAGYHVRIIAEPREAKLISLWLILNLIFLVVFNLFFFLHDGFPRSMSMWISYGFVHFAFLMLIVTPKLVSKGKSSAVFGFTLYSISATYFVVAIVVAVFFILVAPESPVGALLIQLVLAGVYGLVLIPNMIANEQTAGAEDVRQLEIDYVKSASLQIKGMLGIIEDKDIAKKVEKAYDAIYSSPVKTHPSVAQIEMRIIGLIQELYDSVLDGKNESIESKINILLQAINDRNIRLGSFN